MIGSQELSQSYPSILATALFLFVLFFGPLLITWIRER